MASWVCTWQKNLFQICMDLLAAWPGSPTFENHERQAGTIKVLASRGKEGRGALPIVLHRTNLCQLWPCIDQTQHSNNAQLPFTSEGCIARVTDRATQSALEITLSGYQTQMQGCTATPNTVS